MKKIQNFMMVGLLSLTMSAIYGCEANPKEKTKILLAHQVHPDRDSKSNIVKIALLLDTSNSMDGLINQAKSQLWDIVNEFTRAKCGNSSRPELQIAIYQYGNDDLSYREGYVQQVLSFSSDLDEISEKLFSLTTNGGEEYCGEVIQTSLNQLEWGKNPDNLKMIFIAGNEPFTQGKLNYKDAASNAKKSDVIVNTIFCGSYEQGIETDWKTGAQLTGGEYMAIDHNREVVHIETPYDNVIIKLNSRLNRTYLGYGSLGASRVEMQSIQDNNALAMEAEVAVKRAVSKSSRLYSNKNWDLVDAAEDEDFDITKLNKANLPAELKDKSEKEIAAHIETKRKEREQIQIEIADLNQKRQAYISKNQNEDSKGELESAMLKAIKKQAALKNYNWD